MIRAVLFEQIIDHQHSTLSQISIGKVNTIIAADAIFLEAFAFYINTIVIFPCMIIPLTIILLFEFGWVAFLLPVMSILCVIAMTASSVIKKPLIFKQRYYSDMLSKKLDEMAKGIKNIKYNGWEDIIYK